MFLITLAFLKTFFTHYMLINACFVVPSVGANYVLCISQNVFDDEKGLFVSLDVCGHGSVPSSCLSVSFVQ